MEVRSRTFRGRMWRGLELFVAAVVMLALIQLHSDIVRSALSLVGLEETPTLLAIRDSCGERRWLPPVLAGFNERQTEDDHFDCGNSVDLWVIASWAQDTALFVNGVFARSTRALGRLIQFPTVKLREGVNELTVISGEQQLYFPYSGKNMADVFLSINAIPEFDRYFRKGAHSIRLFRQQKDTTAEQPAVPTRLNLQLTLLQSRDIEVDAEACLHKDHPALVWMRDEAMRGPEFVAHMFQTIVVSNKPVKLTNPIWKTPFPVTLEPAVDEAECVPVRTQYVIPDATIFSQSLPGSQFLSAAGHRLELYGFAGTIMNTGRSPDIADADRMVWQGVSGEAARQMLMIFSMPKKGQRPVRPPDAEPTKRSIFSAFLGLQNILPQLARALLWGLAAAAPVALIFWAMGRAQTTIVSSGRITRARYGVLALLVFMLAFALYPLLVEVTQVVMNTTRLASALSMPWIIPRTRMDLYAPLAVVVAFLIVPVLRAGRSLDLPSPRRFRRLFSALISLLLLAAAALCLFVIQIIPVDGLLGELLDELPLELGVPEIMQAETQRLMTLGILLGIWLLLGLLAFWVPFYWLFTVAASGARVWVAAFASAVVVFLLPLAAAVSDIAPLGLAISQGVSSFLLLGPMFSVFSTTTNPFMTFASVFAVFVIVAVVLRGFREITAEMLSLSDDGVFRKFTRTPYLLVLTLVIVWPLFGNLAAQAGLIGSATVRLMVVFQAYGVLLALLAPLAVAQELDHVSVGRSVAERYQLPEGILLLSTAAFAGYLTLWHREPLSVVILMLVGWFLIQHVVLATDRVANKGQPAEGLANRLSDFVSKYRLLNSRRKALEKKFAEGDLETISFSEQRMELDVLKQRLESDLGISPDQAKISLFQYGPGDSPLQNGTRGALAGLIVAAFLQLVLPFDFGALNQDSQSGWMTLFEKIFIDPSYQMVAGEVHESGLLVFLNEVLNATFVWVIAGFLFGYVFHLIRGNDGFQKAAVFGAGIALPYVLSQAMIADGTEIPVTALARVVPILVFLLVLGVLIFDGATLRRQGIGLARLPVIYGLRTSIGYVSFAGGLAAIEPLLELLDWLF